MMVSYQLKVILISPIFSTLCLLSALYKFLRIETFRIEQLTSSGPVVAPKFSSPYYNYPTRCPKI